MVVRHGNDDFRWKRERKGDDVTQERMKNAKQNKLKYADLINLGSFTLGYFVLNSRFFYNLIP